MKKPRAPRSDVVARRFKAGWDIEEITYCAPPGEPRWKAMDVEAALRRAVRGKKEAER